MSRVLNLCSLIRKVICSVNELVINKLLRPSEGCDSNPPIFYTLHHHAIYLNAVFICVI